MSSKQYNSQLTEVKFERDALGDVQECRAEMDGKRGSIHQEWIDGPVDPTLLRDELLHEIFEARVDAQPDRIAVCCGDRHLSYGELDRAANRLARHLRAQGVRAEDRVAMLLPRGDEAVYVALLAILKSGAAYVPLDADYPPDRTAYIRSDCNVRTTITTAELAQRHGMSRGEVVLVDLDEPEISRRSSDRLSRAQTDANPANLCYVIYTSGSTGRPKGVQITHRSACHLVRAEAKLFKVTPEDRVYQGFSIAFDASVEEVWLAFASGAALVVGTADVVRDAPALSGWLGARGVTVLSCVPTVLSLMSEPIPSLRLLIVGGEACPQDLVRRWCKAGLRMVNTYGPTEGTVIATWAELHPLEPVTIGQPIPNYRVYLLDAERQPVTAGATGEIYIGGPGVARGYVGLPELTAQRFVDDPLDPEGGRLYRSGDLGRYLPDRRIEFLGRADSQVKLRGFRIELEEVESALMRCPGVRAAAAAVREDEPGVQQLVAYLVPEPEQTIQLDRLRPQLRRLLPAYMTPTRFELVSAFPLLPSGKIDRSQLPRPRAAHTCDINCESSKADDASGTAAANPIEAELRAECGRLFDRAVSLSEDFFADLGGHSLLAARLVSTLRCKPNFQTLSVSDVYAFPVLRSLADELCRRAAQREAATQQPAVDASSKPKRRSTLLCGFAQLPGLYGIMALNSAQWLGPYLVYELMTDHGAGAAAASLAGLAVLLAFFPILLALPIAAKWLLLGRIRPGTYPLWGGFYVRWWLVRQLVSMAPTDLLVGSPLLNLWLRALGANVHATAYLGTDNVAAFDLLSIGPDSSVGYDANLLGYTVRDGMLHIGPITIGSGCFVGARSVLGIGTQVEDGASLGDLSMLPAHDVVPCGQAWVGSPARLDLSANLRQRTAPPTRISNARRGFLFALHSAGICLLPMVDLLAVFPGLLVLFWARHRLGFAGALLASPAAAACFVTCVCLQIAGLKWLLLGRLKAGEYSIHSFFYLRKWFFDRLMDSSMDVLGPLYATLYLNPWYRLLGVRLGKGAEVSTACGVTPDLTQVDEESFIADAVCLGAPRVEHGRMTLARTHVGRRSFVGNSALVPAGTTLGESTLIGVLSTTPASTPGASAHDTSWLGSPAIFLPQRQVSRSFAEERTFKPTRRFVAQRLAIELVRVLLPTTMLATIAVSLIELACALRPHVPTVGFVGLFPLLYAAGALGGTLFVIAAKWMLMGRYRAHEWPLWSTFVWRTELVTALHEHLADPLLVEWLTGTPLIAWFFRLLGARVGKRVFMETTALTEFDLISIGDVVALNLDCTVQTHLFEDRVMKMSRVTICAGCSVGAGAIVLYDTAMGPGSTLGDLSLLMKGETLPTNTHWAGTPAGPARVTPNTHEGLTAIGPDTSGVTRSAA